jgi:hypothetical protein
LEAKSCCSCSPTARASASPSLARSHPSLRLSSAELMARRSQPCYNVKHDQTTSSRRQQLWCYY